MIRSHHIDLSIFAGDDADSYESKQQLAISITYFSCFLKHAYLSLARGAVWGDRMIRAEVILGNPTTVSRRGRGKKKQTEREKSTRCSCKLPKLGYRQPYLITNRFCFLFIIVTVLKNNLTFIVTLLSCYFVFVVAPVLLFTVYLFSKDETYRVSTRIC